MLLSVCRLEICPSLRSLHAANKARLSFYDINYVYQYSSISSGYITLISIMDILMKARRGIL